MKPKISVVVATTNPRPCVIRWALRSLAQQTMPLTGFEVVIVDNNSNPPLDEETLRHGSNLSLAVVRESRQGVTFARCTGIIASRAELIVFLDDDNYVDSDYLEQALQIADGNPTIGAFGGISRFLSDAVVPGWKEALFPYLGVRDYGADVITSNEDRWGPWEPIGAGMVFRKDVGLEFVNMVKTVPGAQLLGRRRDTYICGEDSLLARLAYRLGYSCSYQPALQLTHMINSSRLSPKTLARTVEGVAQAYVIYESILGRPAPVTGILSTVWELFSRCRHRIRSRGYKAGLIEWFWDVGYFRQARAFRGGAPRKDTP